MSHEQSPPELLDNPDRRLLIGKVAIITGGNSGIGAAIAHDFAREGVKRIYVYSRSSADAVAETVTPYGTELIWVRGDITNQDDIHGFVSSLQNGGEKVDILVNNAGVTNDNKFKDNDWGDVDKVFATNIIGPMTLTAGLLRQNILVERGSIVNVSSVMGLFGNEGQEKYAATKAAVIGFSKSLMRSVRHTGIRVNVVAPGFIETKMTSAIAGDETARQLLEDLTPAGRLGKPEDVAHLVSFLSSEKALYINGVVIPVDGGIEGAVTAVMPLSDLWRKFPDGRAIRGYKKWLRQQAAEQPTN